LNVEKMLSANDGPEKHVFVERFVLLRFVFNPTAVALAGWVGRTRVTPNVVTVTWLGLIVIAPILPFMGLGPIAIIGFFAASYFLDCLDGALARETGKSSALGKLMDDFGGDVFNVSFWISLANVQLVQGVSHFDQFAAYTGYGIGLVSLLRGNLLHRAAFLHADLPHTGLSGRKYSIQKTIRDNVFNFGGVLFPIALIMTWLEATDILLAVSLANATLLFGTTTISVARLGRATDQKAGKGVDGQDS
jgi:phosphatidylglycerophosphate synthase